MGLAPGTDVVEDHCSAKTTHQDDGFFFNYYSCFCFKVKQEAELFQVLFSSQPRNFPRRE
jgi:hypothetical protein